jgi:uncharacterized protein (TIGR00297 family)
MISLRDTIRNDQSSPTRTRPYKNIGLGLLFSTAIALLAYQRKSLSRSGVVGAILSGTHIFGLGGWAWAVTLIYFFTSSSILSHFKVQEKEQTAKDKFSKGNRRDLGQVFANGGVGTLLALSYATAQTEAARQLFEVGYIGSLATATADTWATEIGVLSTAYPRLITTGKRTSPGTSGGITTLGTGASAGGALSLGLVFWLLKRGKTAPQLPWIALCSGLAGSLVDSYLGATIQAMYYCPICQKETERSIHSCGTQTQALRGISWLNNDVVNFLATLSGAGIAMLLHFFLIRKGAQSLLKD